MGQEKLLSDEELYHHGILGQKWGIRRYQNADGTLTSEGRERMLARARKYESKANITVGESYSAKLRRAKLNQKAKDARYEVKKSDLKKARLKKAAQKNSSENGTKKSVKDMSDDELRREIARTKLENEYKQLHPKQVSAGQKFVSYLFKRVIVPSATSVGTAYFTKVGKQWLGLSSDNK